VTELLDVTQWNRTPSPALTGAAAVDVSESDSMCLDDFASKAACPDRLKLETRSSPKQYLALLIERILAALGNALPGALHHATQLPLLDAPAEHPRPTHRANHASTTPSPVDACMNTMHLHTI
jgi:hypothetical protein